MNLSKAENTFSRIANGNFSSGAAYWEGAGLIVITTGSQQAGPVQSGMPRYVLNTSSTFRANIPYKDLAVYPSVMSFNESTIAPYGINEVLIRSPRKFNQTGPIWPFRALINDTDFGPTVERGSQIYITDTQFKRYSGEYRAGTLVEVELTPTLSNFYLRASASFEIPTIATKSDYPGSFYAYDETGNSNQYQIQIVGNFNNIVRPDGTTGRRPQDHFVCENPEMNGRVVSVSADGTTATITSFDPFFRPPDTGGSFTTIVGDWYIAERFDGNMVRTIPVPLYDLTLAFSLENSSVLDPDQDIDLIFYDEMGNVEFAMDPVPIGATSADKHLSKPIPGTQYTRIVMRFTHEFERAFSGTAKVEFRAGGTTSIGDVVLYRGSYTQQLLQGPSTTTETFDYLEHPVSQESEIIPRGTIIAYVGGSACPPGYTQLQGIGSIAPKFLGVNNLWVPLGDPGTIVTNSFRAYLNSQSDNLFRGGTPSDPTLVMVIDATGNQVLEDAIVSSVPGHMLEFRFTATGVSVFANICSIGKIDTSASVSTVGKTNLALAGTASTSGGHSSYPPSRLNDNSFSTYNDITTSANPDPNAWMEISWATPQIISHFWLWTASPTRRYLSQARIEYWTGSAWATDRTYPAQTSKNYGINLTQNRTTTRLRLINFLTTGAATDASQAYEWQIFGFATPPPTIDLLAIQILGEFSETLQKAQTLPCTMYIWKNGVIGVPQNAADLGVNHSAGGYGFIAGPHTHFGEQSSDVGEYSDVGHTFAIGGGGNRTELVLSDHKHNNVVTSSSIPQVRTVLLCQKL